MATDWERAFSQALMGDEESIKAIGQRLRIGPGEDDTRERADYLDAVAEFREHYRDLVNNEADFERVKELEQRLAKQYPKLDYRDRFNIVGAAVRGGVGAGEASREAGTSDVIRQIKESRGPKLVRTGKGNDPRGSARSQDDDDQAAIRRRQGRWHGQSAWAGPDD